MNKEEYIANPKKCLECSTQLPFEKRVNTFCGSSCSATHTNPKKLKKKPKTRKCAFCKQETPNPKFCRLQCEHEHRKARTNSRILKGLGRDPRTIKEFLVEQRGPACEWCKLTKWRAQPILLVLDHIDGNHTNNAIENLRLLCSNCDAQTDTYKSKNKGNGRFARRKRYKEGKSY